VADNGFQACYISGAAITASSGVPDIGLVTMDGFVKAIKEVHLSSGLPVLADADTGFGEGEMVAKAVWEYYIAGASGLHLEDQVFPKRCGHLDGKELISAEDMVKKVEIAVKASQECSDGEFVICARTDARGVSGIDETIRRAKLYIDAGADMIFPEGLISKEEFEKVSKALTGYGKKGGPFLLANMTEFGKTPFIPLPEFEKMGYHCVIFPVTTLRVASKAVDLFLKDLKKNGSAEGSLKQMQTREELYDLLGYKPGKEWYFPSKMTSRPKKSKSQEKL
jgi:methylisocitrate lyase